MCRICEINGIDFLLERSRSGKGAHLWLFFETPILASVARKFGYALLEKGAEEVNLKSFKYYDRMLPAQDRLPEGGLGNLIALPLQGGALRDGNSAFVDGNWNAYPNQWFQLMKTPRISKQVIEETIKMWKPETKVSAERERVIDEEGERIKPWNKKGIFSKNDIDGKMSINL